MRFKSLFFIPRVLNRRSPGCDCSAIALLTTFRFPLEKKWGSGFTDHSACAFAKHSHLRDRTGLIAILTSLRRPGECDDLITTFKFSLEKNRRNAFAKHSHLRDRPLTPIKFNTFCTIVFYFFPSIYSIHYSINSSNSL